MVNVLKYFCSKCNRFHYRGEIYDKHLEYKEEELKKKDTSKFIGKKSKKKKKIPSDKVINFNYESLRPIAKRQIDRLYKKMRKTNNKELYIFQINKVILHEEKAMKGGLGFE